MHKILPFVIFLCLPFSAFSSEQELEALGDIVPFHEPLQVNVTVIEKVRGLIYWAEPDLVEPQGIEDVNAYIERTKTNNYMASPFLFQFRVAGVHKDDDSGEDLNKDDFSKKTAKTIDSAFEGKKFRLICYGYYSSTIVPYCDLTDEENGSPVVGLISMGLVVPDEKFGMADEGLKEAFTEALESAKKQQMGMWKPYHSMFRGLH